VPVWEENYTPFRYKSAIEEDLNIKPDNGNVSGCPALFADLGLLEGVSRF
jgi:hypothetical protein